MKQSFFVVVVVRQMGMFWVLTPCDIYEFWYFQNCKKPSGQNGLALQTFKFCPIICFRFLIVCISNFHCLYNCSSNSKWNLVFWKIYRDFEFHLDIRTLETKCVSRKYLAFAHLGSELCDSCQRFILARQLLFYATSLPCPLFPFLFFHLQD